MILPNSAAYKMPLSSIEFAVRFEVNLRAKYILGMTQIKPPIRAESAACFPTNAKQAAKIHVTSICAINIEPIIER